MRHKENEMKITNKFGLVRYGTIKCRKLKQGKQCGVEKKKKKEEQ